MLCLIGGRYVWCLAYLRQGRGCIRALVKQFSVRRPNTFHLLWDLLVPTTRVGSADGRPKELTLLNKTYRSTCVQVVTTYEHLRDVTTCPVCIISQLLMDSLADDR